MEFMKRAVERQRQEARQEAEQLIQALQEEKEFDEEEEKEEEPAENAAILSALAEGGVRRQKKKGKSLEVTEHIALGADRSASGGQQWPARPAVHGAGGAERVRGRGGGGRQPAAGGDQRRGVRARTIRTA